jgi:hypothetical protein
MFTSWPIASIMRRRIASPVQSPFSASSSARIALSMLALSPWRLSIRLARRQMSISGITPEGYPVSLYLRLMRYDQRKLRRRWSLMLSVLCAVSALMSPLVAHNARVPVVAARAPAPA